jgi:hypothetical protein
MEATSLKVLAQTAIEKPRCMQYRRSVRSRIDSLSDTEQHSVLERRWKNVSAANDNSSDVG